ncbi:MAG: Holliday junction resolvase RuvX [Turicibacter sp.]|nr:Holliday junction resolvase RuvX [Turicibacter sp.]
MITQGGVLKSRMLGLDYGDKTIGVAVSDPFGMMALGLTTLWRKHPSALKPSLRELREIVNEYTINAIVLGFPKRMNNTEGERCAKTLLFKDRLTEYFGLDVVLWDERLSTAWSKRIIHEKNDKTRSTKKSSYKNVDEIAAVIILQGYIDFLNNSL